VKLDSYTISRLFGVECNHVPVAVRRLSGARILWLNRRAIKEDPKFSELGCQEAAYEQMLLDSCAYQVDPSVSLAATMPTPDHRIAFADRYGGAGIGSNGGSGRGICVNGYQIKGVGRTPLVSRLTKESHASGGAYLEECVRETIFSEVVASEFPIGSVPTLAIIDTGLIQIWNMGIGQKCERRTLLVRPYFLRPAHFERAVGFVSCANQEGLQDHIRVTKTFATALEIYGRTGLRRMFDDLWVNWARQLAYSFIHRLPPGNNTPSNISFDGRLVDFGSMCAAPSWANAATSFYHHPFTDQFANISRAIKSLSYYFGRHFDSSMGKEGAVSEQIATATKIYQQTVCSELLRLCGVPRDVAEKAVADQQLARLWSMARSVIAHYQAEQIDMVMSVPDLRIPWDLHQIWGTVVPGHLRPLRRLLGELMPLAIPEVAALECAARSASRPLLYAPSMKTKIFEALDCGPQCSPNEDRARVGELIDRYVTSSLRMSAKQ
jgi:hypothetical protein